MAKSTARGIRVPANLQEQIERIMERRGIAERSTMVVELVEEAVRVRRAPGIVFVDGATGRRAPASDGIALSQTLKNIRLIGQRA